MPMICPKCQTENKDDSKFCSNCAAPLWPIVGAGPEGASVTRTLETPLHILKAGALIAGKYRIFEEIGAGGMGVVYKAEDIKLKRSVALKFLPPNLMDSPDLKERFLIEAQAAAALSHPNICVIHEIGESEGRPYIAMEYVEGETLRDRVRKGSLEPGEAVDIVNQVASGLAEAHGKGIIHRDVKSANIMVTAKGQAKVMDFGLAKLRGGSSLTRTQTTLGTVAYMSPEQARGEELDQRTDIWSLGVVLYELLSGKLPFKGDHDQTVIHSILHKPPKPPSKVRPDLPSGLDEIVFKSLVKNTGNRYQSMEEVRGDLAAVAEGLRPLKARLPRTFLGIRMALIYSALALALALFIGLDVGGLRSRIFGGEGRGERAITLAVLPFINDSPDQENTYFINGVMEEILSNLQKIKALRVISRTSVEQYRDRKKPVREIAEELDVKYIVEGSGQKYGNAFRLRMQLIMAEHESHLWGESFQQNINDVKDIFYVQIRIAESVAGALKAVIAPEEKRLIEKVPTADQMAYDSYLRGNFYMNGASPDDVATALHYFEEARNRDPRFALAYVGISGVWLFRQQLGWAAPEEAGPKIVEAVERALELDSTLADVHSAVASMKVYGEFDLEGGEAALKKALEINPNHAQAHADYSHLLNMLGRTDEAMENIELALRLDPHNPAIKWWYAQDLLYARRYDEAISVSRDIYEKNPSMNNVLDCIYHASHVTGRYDQAFEAIKLLYSKELADLDHVFDRFSELGYAGTLSLEADTLLAQAGSRYIAPTFLYDLYTFAGNKERALDEMEKAYEVRDPNILYIGRPSYAILRDELRYQELLRKLKLPIGDKKWERAL